VPQLARRNGRVNKLRRYLDDLIAAKVFRTRRQIAEECGTSDQGLSQALSDPLRRLSVGQCLRLARKIKEHPASVLRVAGRPEDADVLDDLWPRKQDTLRISPAERELIEQWRYMAMTERQHLSALIDICAERARARTDGHVRPVRGGPRMSLPQPKRASR